MLLITTFVELRVVAGRSHTRAGRAQAVLCRGLEKNGMVRAWHGHGTASVNQTRLYCVNQIGKIYSKPLGARHVRGTAWARYGRGTAWARHGHGMLCVNRPSRVLWLQWTYSVLNKHDNETTEVRSKDVQTE
jgi:hypothetical protein